MPSIAALLSPWDGLADKESFYKSCGQGKGAWDQWGDQSQAWALGKGVGKPLGGAMAAMGEEKQDVTGASVAMAMGVMGPMGMMMKGKAMGKGKAMDGNGCAGRLLGQAEPLGPSAGRPQGRPVMTMMKVGLRAVLSSRRRVRRLRSACKCSRCNSRRGLRRRALGPWRWPRNVGAQGWSQPWGARPRPGVVASVPCDSWHREARCLTGGPRIQRQGPLL